jgi:ActR/RegA family two-component response regulator
VTRNRILVVDDDTSLRRVMKMQLEEAGYEVSIASDGNQAYSMLKDLQPTLIVTDLRMPTSGLELLGADCAGGDSDHSHRYHRVWHRRDGSRGDEDGCVRLCH